MEQLYKAIRARRIELGMSQDELANAVGYNSRSTIARIEKGEIDIPISSLLKLSIALRLPISDLLNQNEKIDAIDKDYVLRYLSVDEEQILEEIVQHSEKSKRLKQAFRDFNKERDWDQFHTPENLAKSISIEAAELLECFQWNNDFDKAEVCEELADVLSYCIMMADKLDVDIEKIVLDKLEKTKAKYPVDKAKGVSTKYNKLK